MNNAASILNNHGAMSRFRSQNGLRSTKASRPRAYVVQQTIVRELLKLVPEQKIEREVLALRLGTYKLEPGRVENAVYRLKEEKLYQVEDTLQEDPKAALRLVMLNTRRLTQALV